MNNPINYNISDNDFYIWASKIGIKYMKYFDTPENTVDFIKNNPYKCVNINKTQGLVLPYEKWIKDIRQEQEKWLNEKGKKQTHSKSTKHTQQKTTNSSTETSKDKIISCPSCKQKIKIRLPLPSNIGKCVKCLSRFELMIDSDGSLYITLIENKIFFDKLINGDLGLAKTFWIYNILVNIVLAIIYQVDLINANTTVFWIINIPHIIYYTIVLLGIWIASNKYKGKQYWAILAKVYVVVQLLFALFVMVNILNTVT